MTVVICTESMTVGHKAAKLSDINFH